MGYLYTEESCSPLAIRFTKEKISPRFSAPHNEETIFDMLEKIQGGLLDPSVFPTIRVVRFGGELWTVDNRRLWLFQKAGVESIMVKHFPMEKSKAFKKFLSKTPLAHVQMMSAKQFVPQVDYAWDGLVDIFVRVKKWLRADDIKSDDEEEQEDNTEWEDSPGRSSDEAEEVADAAAVEIVRDEDDQDFQDAQSLQEGQEMQYPVLWNNGYADDEREREIYPVYK